MHVRQFIIIGKLEPREKPKTSWLDYVWSLLILSWNLACNWKYIPCDKADGNCVRSKKEKHSHCNSSQLHFGKVGNAENRSKISASYCRFKFDEIHQRYLCLVSDEPMTRWGIMAASLNTPQHSNFKMPCLVSSNDAASRGFSPVTLLKLYSLKPGGNVGVVAPPDGVLLDGAVTLPKSHFK